MPKKPTPTRANSDADDKAFKSSYFKDSYTLSLNFRELPPHIKQWLKKHYQQPLYAQDKISFSIYPDQEIRLKLLRKFLNQHGLNDQQIDRVTNLLPKPDPL